MRNSAKLFGFALFAAGLLASAPAQAKTLTFIHPNTRVITYHGVVTALPNVPVIMPGMIYSPAVSLPEVRIYTWSPDIARHREPLPAPGYAYIIQNGSRQMIPPASRIVIDASE